MLLNASEQRVVEKIRAESEANPLAAAISTAVGAFPGDFEVVAEGAGLEVRACGYLEGGVPNRARMKVFSPKPGHTLVFFYKKSLLPYSRDRYSYGGFDLRIPGVSDEEIAEWLVFLSSGLHPEKRPANLRRASRTRFPSEVLGTSADTLLAFGSGEFHLGHLARPLSRLKIVLVALEA